ncbi:MAG: hypothetical protein ACOYOK_11870 [Pseudobdellovibrionaceae bacterium]
MKVGIDFMRRIIFATVLLGLKVGVASDTKHPVLLIPAPSLIAFQVQKSDGTKGFDVSYQKGFLSGNALGASGGQSQFDIDPDVKIESHGELFWTSSPLASWGYRAQGWWGRVPSEYSKGLYEGAIRWQPTDYTVEVFLQSLQWQFLSSNESLSSVGMGLAAEWFGWGPWGVSGRIHRSFFAQSALDQISPELYSDTEIFEYSAIPTLSIYLALDFSTKKWGLGLAHHHQVYLSGEDSTSSYILQARYKLSSRWSTSIQWEKSFGQMGIVYQWY